MTSVRNHRQRLNGNSIIVLFLLLLTTIACSTTKKTGKPTTNTPPVRTEDKVSVYDPATGTYILVPRDAVKVDTIKWTEDKSAPIVTDKGDPIDSPDTKDKYEISLLVPLNSENYPDLETQIDSRLSRFLHYYGGMRIAAEEIEKQGLPVTVRTFDTEISVATLNEILKDPALRRSDVIVGPYDKENIEAVASFGALNEKIVVSPWLPAFNLDSENPYFIQTVPGLSKNAEAIMDYIADELSDRKIYLVARNNPTEIQRLTSFKKNTALRTEDLIIDDTSIELAKTNLGFLLDDREGTIFIMPYYAKTDEQFVSSFLRKLHADKGTHDVIVFGLPQWTGFSNLNPNYMESLSVHISSPTHVNTDHSTYRSFRDKFYRAYFTMPDSQAYLGYDLLMWLAHSLEEGGKDALTKGKPSGEFGLASGFDIKPVYKSDSNRPSDIKKPLYYENAKVRILKYVNQDFEVAR